MLPEVQQKIVITSIRNAVKVLQAVEELLEQEVKGMTPPPWNKGYVSEMVKHWKKNVVNPIANYEGFGLKGYEGESLFLFPLLMEGTLKTVQALREQYAMVRNREQAYGHWSDGSEIHAIYATPMYTEEHRTLVRELSVAQGIVIAQANALQYLLEPDVVEELVRSG